MQLDAVVEHLYVFKYRQAGFSPGSEAAVIDQLWFQCAKNDSMQALS